MTYVITQPCIGVKDASCVDVCPVDCIHPTSSEEGFETAEQLYINPDECIDCGACEPACPVTAIFEESAVPEEWKQYLKVNVDFFRDGGDVTFKTVAPSELVKLDLSNVRFDIAHAEIGSTQIVDQTTQDLTNETPEVQKSTFRVEFSYAEKRHWSTTSGIKEGTQTAITAGIPFFEEAGKIQLQISSEVSFSFTWGTEVTVARKYSSEIPVTIPPHSKVICKASVSLTRVTIPYSAEAVYHFSNGQQEIRKDFAGTYDGTTAHVQASWTTPPTT